MVFFLGILAKISLILASFMALVSSPNAISSESICPTVSDLGNTLSNPVNTLSAKRAAILLTNPECVSDSCTMIFFLNILVAMITGSATYPPLQNTTSILYSRNRNIDCTRPNKKEKKSLMFMICAINGVSLRYFPEKIVTKWLVYHLADNLSLVFFSKLFLPPNR